MSTTSRHARARGVTLVELILFILIVGVAVAGTMRVLNLTTANSVDPQLRKQALTIAASLLEEIELAHFTFCDPTDATADTAAQALLGAGNCTSVIEDWDQEAGAPGRPYDNINDYVPASGVKTYTSDAEGTPFFNTGYVATVTISPEPNLGPSGAGIVSNNTFNSMNVLRIHVRVSYPPNADFVELDGIRTRYAPNALP